MKKWKVAFATLVFIACAGEESKRSAVSETDNQTPGEKSVIGQASDDPCEPLNAEMVRYDTAGKPFFFSFAMPRGFTVREWYGPGVAGADITLNLDGKGGDEYVLRLAQSDAVNENAEGLVEVWRKLPVTESVIEKDVDGRTMYIQRANIAGMTGLIVLFPAFDSDSGAHQITGGVTSAPKPCRAKAAETVASMIASFQRNPSVGANPGDTE